MKKNFYRAFEDRHRGSRQLIRSRLEVYAPFMRPFLDLSKERPLGLDLGCGRGEWLELVRDWGFEARGVDLDEGMLDACNDIGLQTSKQDAISCLQSLPDESLWVISAFHLVEHIPFADLEILVSESYRVLRPGGLLILETPNPENLTVGTERFHLDPTHTQPIPHPLLGFLLEHNDFHRTKTLLLQEPKGVQEKQSPGLWDVLEGVSPDYGVIGQKKGPAELLSRWDAVFEKHYGQALGDIAQRYDVAQSQKSTKVDELLDTLAQGMQSANKEHLSNFQSLGARIERMEVLSRVTENRLTGLVQESSRRLLAAVRAQYEAERQQLMTQHRHQDFARSQLLVSLQQQLAVAHEESIQFRQQVSSLHEQLHAMHRSTSWKISSPVRLLGRLMRRWRAASMRPSTVQAPSSAAPLVMENVADSNVPSASAKQDEPSTLPEKLPMTQMTPTGTEVYRHLHAAIEKRSSTR